ncbi:hypothetical protein [Pragia fontium]|uniref:hypothetical protein n=1 Tax=Pragia fontium TaxID=82985 RepID=UPI000F70BDFF|nr:hypothetical protein [Pragia fontium]VEJ54576.1 Uncharacterised protein [Pragia fontium]
MKETIEYIKEYLAYDNLYRGITPALAHQLANDLVRDIQAGAVPNIVFTEVNNGIRDTLLNQSHDDAPKN